MPTATRPRRSWLGNIQGLLMALLILDFVGLVVSVLPSGAIQVGSVSLIDLWNNEPVLPPRAHPEVSPAGQIPILLSTSPSPLMYVLYKLGHGFIYVAVWIPILIFAMRIVGTARQEDPFTLAMVKRLRRLGFLMLTGGVAVELTAYLSSLAVLNMYLDQYNASPMMRAHAIPDYSPSAWWLLPGLILLGFSEIVRRGVDLRAELDTVI